jgi:hypothetical protein
MSTTFPYGRILRRETHSPRSALAIAVAVAVIVLCAYAGTEILLAMLNRRALLAAPQDMLTALARLGTAAIALPVAIGIVLMVLGVLLIIGALTPGRRARHQLAAERAAVVVDNEVIASALARHAAHAGNADPDNTVVSVSTRQAIVRVTPTSGTPVRREAVAEAVREQLAAFELIPPIRPSVVIASGGRVGA